MVKKQGCFSPFMVEIQGCFGNPWSFYKVVLQHCSPGVEFCPVFVYISTMKAKKQTGTKAHKPPEYDSAWKDVIEEHFEQFMEFFFPAIHKDIDFSKKPEVLSKELRKIVPESKVGKRFADILIKVYLKDGSLKCICIFAHVEVQGTRIPNFMERIFIYYYRIYDKYKEKGAEVISLAILTDEDDNYRPDEHRFARWDFDLRLKIPLVKIIDFKNKDELREKLATSLNPMGMVVNAQLKSFEVKKGNTGKKFDVKRELIRRCYKHGYDKQYISSLLHFIDLIFRLPESFERKLSEEISHLEEEHKMPHVTSWERIAKKDGRKEGKMEGRKEGVLEAKQETAKKMLHDGLPIETIAKYTGLTEKQIKALMN